MVVVTKDYSSVDYMRPKSHILLHVWRKVNGRKLAQMIWGILMHQDPGWPTYDPGFLSQNDRNARKLDVTSEGLDWRAVIKPTDDDFEAVRFVYDSADRSTREGANAALAAWFDAAADRAACRVGRALRAEYRVEMLVQALTMQFELMSEAQQTRIRDVCGQLSGGVLDRLLTDKAPEEAFDSLRISEPAVRIWIRALLAACRLSARSRSEFSAPTSRTQARRAAGNGE
jgi:hypothetical protein